MRLPIDRPRRARHGECRTCGDGWSRKPRRARATIGWRCSARSEKQCCFSVVWLHVVRRLVVKAHDRIAPPVAAGTFARLPGLAARSFWTRCRPQRCRISIGLLMLLGLGPAAEPVALALILATMGVQSVLLVARALLMPRMPSLRMLLVGDRPPRPPSLCLDQALQPSRAVQLFPAPAGRAARAARHPARPDPSGRPGGRPDAGDVRAAEPRGRGLMAARRPGGGGGAGAGRVRRHAALPGQHLASAGDRLSVRNLHRVVAAHFRAASS